MVQPCEIYNTENRNTECKRGNSVHYTTTYTVVGQTRSTIICGACSHVHGKFNTENGNPRVIEEQVLGRMQ